MSAKLEFVARRDFRVGFVCAILASAALTPALAQDASGSRQFGQATPERQFSSQPATAAKVKAKAPAKAKPTTKAKASIAKAKASTAKATELAENTPPKSDPVAADSTASSATAVKTDVPAATPQPVAPPPVIAARPAAPAAPQTSPYLLYGGIGAAFLAGLAVLVAFGGGRRKPKAAAPSSSSGWGRAIDRTYRSRGCLPSLPPSILGQP